MTAPILRLSPPALAGAVVVLLAGACGDDVQGPPDEQPDAPSADFLSALIVSNPVEPASTPDASLILAGFASSDTIVFVSLPPGSVSNGETAVIRTRGAEAQATAAMVDGGFDPVPVAAGTGDTLDVRIELAGGGASLAFYTVVPPSIPPVIVRTDPPKKKRDVPLNAVMLIVFSEPIDAATVNASSVQLLLGDVPVAGALEFGDDANLTLTFTPAEPLVPGAEYTLLITRDIEDLDGEALEAPHTVAFTTTAPGPPPGSSAALWGFVADPSGVCIEGATVEVVGGQGLGQKVLQDPCNVWSYGGGFVIRDLIPGVSVTLRASAPGWRPEEETFFPNMGPGGTGTAVEIWLSEIGWADLRAP